MSKLNLYKQAENLYIEEGMSIEDICRNLNISRHTIFYWEKSMIGIKVAIKNINMKAS